MSGKSWNRIWLRSEAQTRREETTNWSKGWLNNVVAHLIERKNVTNKELKASWTKGENGLNELWFKPKFLKVFINGWTNHWWQILMNVGAVQPEDWRKLARKKRNYQTRRLYSLNKEWDLIERKKMTWSLRLRSYKRLARSAEMAREI